MAQSIASGVRVYTARPSLSPSLSLSFSLSLPQQPVFILTIPDPSPLDPIIHQVYTSIYGHTLTSCSTHVAQRIFLLLSTMLCQLLALNRYFVKLSPDVTLAVVERIIAGNLFFLLLLLFLLVCVYVSCDIYIFVI